MDKITLGQISVAVAFLVALIGGITALLKQIRQWITMTFETQLKPLHTEIDGLSKRLDAVDMQGCKNFLVRCISDVENGNSLNEIEKERFYEQYQHYIKAGGNSYIRQKVERLQQDGKI